MPLLYVANNLKGSVTVIDVSRERPTRFREIARISGLPFAGPSAFIEDTRARQLATTLTLAQSQHRAIIEAITAREGARAEALAREHARAARRNAEELLARQR